MFSFSFLVEFDSSKKQQEVDKKAIDDLVRERDILNKNLLKAAGATQKQLSLVRLHEQAKKNLEQEIQVHEVFILFCSFFRLFACSDVDKLLGFFPFTSISRCTLLVGFTIPE